MAYKLKACGVLYDEHCAVKRKVKELEPSLRTTSTGETFARGLGALVRALEAELPPHFAKEEEALFPVMETVTGKGFPPIEVMKAEHAFLIGHFTGLREASAELGARPGVGPLRARAVGHLFPLVSALSDHIVKEDSMLLVMAGEQLEPAHDSKILRVFDEIDREGRHWG